MAYKITDACISCGACADECPVGAISIKDNLAVIDYDICTGCGLCHTVCLRALDHFAEVVDVGVNVTVGEKTDEVERGSVIFRILCERFPCFALENFTGFDRFRNKLCALSENLTGAERVMANLGVTHIVVAHKTNSLAVSLKLHPRIFCHKHIERGSVCVFNRVARAVCGDTYTVHNDSKERTLYALKFS